MDKRSDHELLREFAGNASEAAFATLVDRHIGLVYSAAFRHLNDAHLAEDVTQAVFVLLARKAATISKRTILAGWLYRTARFVSADVLKREVRRRKREQDAVVTSGSVSAPLGSQGSEGKWEQAAPHLDEALSRLGEKDRAAVLLRYFEGKSLQEVGDALGCSEEAARKRIDRAVERLRGELKENGMVPAGGIEGLLSSTAGDSAPVGAAIRATTAALADGVGLGTSVIALVRGALQLMFLTKLKQIVAAVPLVAIPMLLLPGISSLDKDDVPTVEEVIRRHQAESGSGALRESALVERREEGSEPVAAVGTACMSCHRSDRSRNEAVVRQVHVGGEWENKARGLKGVFELRIAGPNRALETVDIVGAGKLVRGRNERAAWSIGPDGAVKWLASAEAEQFKVETDLLIWPGGVEVSAPIDEIEKREVAVAKFDGTKCYRILDERDGSGGAEAAGGIDEVVNYFDTESGFRIGSTWKGAGSSERLINLFQDYQAFGEIMFPSRIVRRRTGSEEVFTVTNLVVGDVSLSIFRPPRDR